KLANYELIYFTHPRNPGKCVSHYLLLTFFTTCWDSFVSQRNNRCKILFHFCFLIKAQKSGSGEDTQAAENLLLINKPLTDLISLLIHLLASDDPDVFEGSTQCLSLMVQLYGGENQDSMSPENIESFADALISRQDPKQQKLLLRIIKRLVSSNERHTESLKNEGDPLIQTLKKLVQTASSRADIAVASLASEILKAVDH
uniref:Uncharacterized protein n=1 Tax=Callorhinchus milii TaxID=7868 RepID=A0A4W3I764_CALMI